MTPSKRWTHNEDAGKPWPCCGKPLGKYEDPGLHTCRPREYKCSRCGSKMTLNEEMAPDCEMPGVSAFTMLEYAKTTNQVRHAAGYLCNPPTTDF